MGRLNMAKFKALLPTLLVAFALTVGSFCYFTVSDSKEPDAKDLKEFLRTNSLTVGADVSGDYQHVYYLYKGKRYFVTDGPTNHNWVRSNGQYITWLETPYQQNTSFVVLYDLLSKTKTQLTFGGSPSRLALQKNRVVWEDRSGTAPEIYYYDGLVVHRISDGKYPSVRPAIHGNQIAYSQELSRDNFQVVVYNTDSKLSEVVATGDSANAWPSFDGDKLITNNSVY